MKATAAASDKKLFQIEPWMGTAERDELLRVIESNFITEGPKTKEFEEACAQYLGTPFCTTTNNATAGLAMALMVLGVGPGHEVLIPDFTFIATANAVTLVGARPVLVDIDPATLTLSLEQIRRHITSRTKAIIPVHLNGRCPDMNRLLAIAREHCLFVVEDAAQAFGSRYEGQCLGTFGDLGVFSLGTTKIITSGQGGLIVTRRKDLREGLIRLKDQGRLHRSEDWHPTIGYNFKFTDLQAAVGLAQIHNINERIARKRALFHLYQQMLADIEEVQFLPMDLQETTPWFVDIFCTPRDELKAYLDERNIQTRRFYYPLHEQPCYRQSVEFPFSSRVSRRGLWLPSSCFLTREEVRHVAQEIRSFFWSRR